jgi:hypothetical protein
MRAFLMGIVLALFSTAALADNALIIGSYNNAPDSVKNRLEAAGHTATIVSTAPADYTGYDQIWDLRWNESFDQTQIDAYDDFVKNGGFLFISTENPGCCNGYNATKAALITQMGGGDTVIGGTAGSTLDVVSDGTNTTYMTNGLTVNFMAISAIENDQGTALITDSNGAVAAMMWVGNAGDLAEGYTGTVITIADINWLAQGFSDPNMSEDNTQALDDIINGVVAGTVAGTISEEGNGEGSDVGGREPAEPEVTETGTEAGDPIVVVTTSDGGTVTTVTTVHGVSETDTEQTVETTVTTALTTATVTQTCTTTTTITNYSDGSSSEAVSNNDESCTSETTYDTTSSATVDTVSGRIDQVATIADVTDVNLRNLSFDGIQGIRSNHDYANGMTGETTGFTLGGEVVADNGLIIGGGWARINTDLSGNGDTAKSNTNAFEGNIGRAMAAGVGTVTLRHANTDYSFNRTIGDWSNTGATSGTNSSISGRYTIATDPKFNPYIGYTIGRKSMDAYTEGGDALTARSVAGTNEMYRYATVGANMQLGLINLHGEYNTDGVQAMGVGIGKTTEKLEWNLGVEKTTTDLGENTGITAGIKIKF